MIRVLARALLAALTVGSAASCAHHRFKDEPVVWHVNDKRNIAEPKPNPFKPAQYFSDILAIRRLPRSLELRDKEPAHNTNALDELPNSTWFTNRIGTRDVTPSEAARASVVHGPPRLPLVAVKGKVGGGNPGFFVKDANGRRFLIKFDTKQNPGMQTGTGVIVNRFFWAIGYNVPSDTLFSFSRSDVTVGPKATLLKAGKERKMVEADIDDVLATSPIRPNGSYRASASEFLPGTPIGGVTPEGRRKDDLNDTIPHEHRRELRGLRVFSAWLGHTDMKEDNTLDMYVEEDGKRFLRHYLLDFGEALGAHQAEKGRYEDGWEHILDWEMQGKALVAFGLWKRPWEDQKQTPWPSIGAFSAEHFEPEKWRESYPYWPFFETDAADSYWAAKIVLRFDRPTIQAIVAEGKFSAAASAYLADTLIRRARKIGLAYVDTVTPLDSFHFDGGRLCAYDLSVYYNLAASGVVEHLGKGRRVVAQYPVDRRGRVCLPRVEGKAYTVARLRVRRNNVARPAMQVHYKVGANPRLLGIVRAESKPCKRRRRSGRCD